MPRWAPNGESIVFEAAPGGNQDIYVVSANGGPARRLTADRGADEWPDWSSDSQAVYLVSGRGGSKEIWKMPVAGGDAIQVTRNANADIPQASRDGSFLYYSKGAPYPASIWRVSTQGGEGTKLFDGVRHWWTVAKDGIYFYYWPDQKGHTDLSVYDFTTGKIRKILTIERPVFRSPAISPDGGAILYTYFDEVGKDIMLVENFR